MIAEVGNDLRSQRLLSEDSGRFIKAATGEPHPEERELLQESASKALTESLLSFLGGSTKDSSAVNEPRI